MSCAAAPAGRVRRPGVQPGDAGAGRPIDRSAGLWGREGGGRGAFVCGVCASEVGPGSPSVPPQCRGLGVRGWARGGRRGRPGWPGCRGPRVWGRGAGSRAGAPRFSRDPHPPLGLRAGPAVRGGHGAAASVSVRDDPASRCTRFFPFSGLVSEGWGWGARGDEGSGV